MPETLLRFSGEVQCAQAAPPLNLTLRGTAGTPPEPAVLAFSAAAPAALPATLKDARIECLAPERYRIVSGGTSWQIEARAAHLHFEVAQVFYRAIPPRRVPLRKRLLFSALLTLAASRAGLALLTRLRR